MIFVAKPLQPDWRRERTAPAAIPLAERNSSQETQRFQIECAKVLTSTQEFKQKAQ
jgi:hypothetical protein